MSVRGLGGTGRLRIVAVLSLYCNLLCFVLRF